MSDDLASQRHTILERLFAAFNRHDIGGVMSCLSPNIVFEAAAGPEAYGQRFIGHDQVSAVFTAVWTRMPDVAWHVRAHTIAGDRAFSEWRFVATQADAGRIDVEGIDLFVFEGTSIVSKRALRKDRPVQPALARSYA